MSEPVDVVITGIIRDNVEFSLILSKVLQWRDDGMLKNIVLSTWAGHVDNFPGFREMLAERGVHLVETVEPKVGSMGNVFLQKVALAQGLAYLDGNPMVLKLRTDAIAQYVFRMPELEEGLRHGLQVPVDDSWGLPRIFENKLVAWGFGYDNFFSITDIFFCARRRDLQKLCVMESGHDIQCSGETICAEQRWFSDPFIQAFPAFRDIFLYFNMPVVARKVSRLVALSAAGEACRIPDFLVNVAALYYAVMQTYFGCFHDINRTLIQLRGAKPALFPNLGFYPFGLATGNTDGLDAFQVMHAIWGGNALGCPLRARFIEAVDRMRRGGWRESSALGEDADALIAFDRSLLPEFSIFWQPDLFARNCAAKARAQAVRDHWKRVGETPGVPLALYPMGSPRESDVVRQLLFSERPYPQACFALYEVYAQGLGVDKDVQKAKFWLSRAAKTESMSYLFAYGNFLFETATTAIEQERALQSIGRAAYCNIKDASWRLIEIAKAFPYLKVSALKHLKEAATEINAWHAQFAFAKWLLEEDGSLGARAQAREWLKRAAGKGNAEVGALLRTLDDEHQGA